MVSDWKELTLGEIAQNISRPFKFKDFEEVTFINTGDVLEGQFLHSNRVSKIGLPGQAKKEIQEGDILFSEIRPANKRFALVDFDPKGYVVSTKFMVIKKIFENIDDRFFYILLTNKITLHEFQRIAESRSGTFPQITFDAVAYFPVKIPPLPEQKAIAHILGSLDDKIELNRQMNETLEAMAQALFKSWFVDFDPVIDNALAAGNAIPDEFIERAEQRKGVEKKDNSDIQSLFPDEFEFTEEMGWIPKGWSVQSFGDLLDSTIGGDWGKPEQDDKHTRESVIIRGTDIPKLKLGERSEAPKRWVEEKKLKTRILKPFDIVIEISGGSPTQSTGRSIIITEQILERLGGVAEPASFCRKFSPLNKFLGLYAGIHLQKIYDDGKMWEYQNQSTGISNFQTTSFLEREELVVPSESVLLKFYETLEPIISKMSSNQQIELARLRDTLLPKLMSGELRIVDAAEMVEDA